MSRPVARSTTWTTLRWEHLAGITGRAGCHSEMVMRPPGEPGPEVIRLRALIRGAVQGVGFRPFVFRLATELGLNGWVNNSAQGVCVEVEGARDRLEIFLA